jgi:hypothetical protein
MLNTARAQELRLALDRFFPSLDFTLVIVNCTDKDASPISRIDGVLEFKMRKSREQEDWRTILKVLQELDQLQQSLIQGTRN